MKIIIFGIGNYTNILLNAVRKDTEIVCCMDNDRNKWGTLFAGVNVCSVDAGIKNDFDYIVIGFTVGFDIAIEQLNSYGISADKILIPYQFDHTKYNIYRDVFYIDELNYIETDIRLRNIENHLNNLPYEMLDDLKHGKIWIPQIVDWRKTINEIVNNGKSISRFGDGEFDLILGRNCSLQDNDDRLALLLEEVLKTDMDDLLIGIPDVFGAYHGRSDEFKEIFRRNLTGGGREKIYGLLDPDKVYYDSFVTRPYKPYMDRKVAAEHFDHIKKIWEKRNVTIIEGAQTRLGVGNDLFAGSNSIERIICPVVNAFRVYDDILAAANNIDRKNLVLIALGPTATVLARDLSVLGYQAIDIGHIDVEYEWFLRGKITAIEGKYVNEAPMGRIVSDDNVPKDYYDQIVARVGV